MWLTASGAEIIIRALEMVGALGLPVEPRAVHPVGAGLPGLSRVDVQRQAAERAGGGILDPPRPGGEYSPDCSDVVFRHA